MRKVYLRDIAGDHNFGAKAQAGEEHLHLRGRGVLGLVKDDKGIIERSAAHIGQRGDLDDAGFHELRNHFWVEHVPQGVVQRAQVRVNLVIERARQEAELLPCLHGRAGEDNARDLLGLQGLHGLGHRQVLPEPAGPIPKTTVLSSMACTYSDWPTVFGRTALPRRLTMSAASAAETDCGASTATMSMVCLTVSVDTAWPRRAMASSSSRILAARATS